MQLQAESTHDCLDKSLAVSAVTGLKGSQGRLKPTMDEYPSLPDYFYRGVGLLKKAVPAVGSTRKYYMYHQAGQSLMVLKIGQSAIVTNEHRPAADEPFVLMTVDSVSSLYTPARCLVSRIELAHNGMPFAVGVVEMTYLESSDRYTGTVCLLEPHGDGCMRYADGSRYEG